MKQIKLTFVLTMLMSMVGLQAFAAWNTSTKVYVDGLCYYLDKANFLAQVTSMSSGKYSGNIEIPFDFIYEGQVYSVTRIANSAFYDCRNLTSVTIPNSVTSIGKCAFEYCSGLTSVTIPNSVTSIESSTFHGCSGLTSITIPTSVTSIGAYAFDGCSKLTSVTIPNSVTSINESTFSGCSSLTSVTIPNSVMSIGNYAFDGCSSFTSVSIGSGVTSIGDHAFNDCRALTKVIVSDIAAWCGISFGDNPLSKAHHLYSDENTEITDLVIPEGATSINGEAFYGCSGLTSVTVGNSVTSIGGSAFTGCTGLTSVTIGNSVTSISAYAFSGCKSLTSVVIGNSVTSISSDTFRGAFYNCTGLTSVIVNAGNTKYDSRDNCNGIIETASNTLILGCMNTTIPNSVTSIGNGAFSSCSGLTSVTIPNSVTSIGEYAFYDCSGLTSITIPNSVTGIGKQAFWHCLSLSSVTLNSNAVVSKAYTNSDNIKNIFGNQVTEYVIGNNVESIGENAFSGCNNLTSVTLNSNAVVSKAYTYSNNFKSIFGEQVTEYVIGDAVTAIGNSAFYGCSGLTSVTIPDNVTSIGAYAFFGCSKLTSVTLNSNAVVSKAYTYSDNFKNIFGDQVTEYVIGDDVTAIGDNAFYGCTRLKSFTIGNNVTSIGYMSFYGCTGLTSVTIPDKVTSIGAYAFRDCSGLESLTIGNGVTSYGNSAFQCSKLTSVTVSSPTPVAITQNVFSNRTNATLYVPKGSKSAYQAANYWKEFKEIIEIDLSEIDEISIQGSGYTNINQERATRYTIDGKRISEPQRGLNIIRTKDGKTRKVVIK